MSTARITRSFFCNRNCSGNFVNLNFEIKLESPYSFRSNDNLYIRNNSFKPQYIHVQILQIDLYTFPQRMSWENFIKDQSIFCEVIILLILIT